MKRTLVLLFIFISHLSMAQNITPTEIFLFDMKMVNGNVHLSGGLNITNRKGYDNQPSFHPSQPVIYYSSFDDSGRSDIKFYNYNTRQTANFTVTREREYSPMVTPDAKFISCILQRDNLAQDLVKYPIEGGKPKVLINHLKIGYHAWAGDNKLFLYVLADNDSSYNSLHYYYLDKDADTVVAENIGRSLHKIPGQNAMAFIQKIDGKESIIKKFDMHTGIISSVIMALPGQDQLYWLQNGVIIMSDGKQLFSYTENAYTELKDRKWQPVIMEGDIPVLKGVTRIAANADNRKLAVVINE